MDRKPKSQVVVALDDQTIDAIAARIFERMQAAPPRVDPIFCNVRDAARLLGISEDALHKRVTRHRVPGVVRMGGRVHFKIDVLRQIKTRR